ncbi:hypothetical protein F5Y18DRAFT_323786 [Xylariaceae sp. FL1019]|nr:hypothetical protein F5Y18DRAFT_323786 [Xylariaceae sp. FL1019]
MPLPRRGQDRPASHKDVGIDEILHVVQCLRANDIICCIVGGRALRYYGVPRAPTDWHVCVPNNDAARAAALFATSQDYEPGDKILPQIKSLLDTYPLFKLKGVNFRIYIMPAFEYFLSDLDESMIEFSRNHNVPYPKLQPYAQSLVSTQRWPELVQLVDGMDIDEDWGTANLQLGMPSEAELEYVQQKNCKITASRPGRNNAAGSLSSNKSFNRTKEWHEIVSTKELRIAPPYTPERYSTQFRRKGSGDPRFKEGKAV